MNDLIELDLKDQSFILSKSKEAYPFIPSIQRAKVKILATYNPREKWKEAHSLEFREDDHSYLGFNYPINKDEMSIESKLILRGHDHLGHPLNLPLVITLRRMPFQDLELNSYNPHELVSKVEAMEDIVERVATDLGNPVYQGAIHSKLVEILGIRSVLPWPLVVRRPCHRVVRGECDFVYYLATWLEETDGPLKNLIQEGWFDEDDGDGHLKSLLLQILVPLLTLHVAKIPMVHNHLTLEMIRYKRLSKTSQDRHLSFWFADQEIRFESFGYRFYLEGWDQATSSLKDLSSTHDSLPSLHSWKDVVSLAFSLEPWVPRTSVLAPLFSHLTNPLVRGKQLSLEHRYAKLGESLRQLLNFQPDQPEDYSLHATIYNIIPSR